MVPVVIMYLNVNTKRLSVESRSDNGSAASSSFLLFWNISGGCWCIVSELIETTSRVFRETFSEENIYVRRYRNSLKFQKFEKPRKLVDKTGSRQRRQQQATTTPLLLRMHNLLQPATDTLTNLAHLCARITSVGVAAVA
jgi:hypothetical protein